MNTLVLIIIIIASIILHHVDELIMDGWLSRNVVRTAYLAILLWWLEGSSRGGWFGGFFIYDLGIDFGILSKLLAKVI